MLKSWLVFLVNAKTLALVYAVSMPTAELGIIFLSVFATRAMKETHSHNAGELQVIAIFSKNDFFLINNHFSNF